MFSYEFAYLYCKRQENLHNEKYSEDSSGGARDQCGLQMSDVALPTAGREVCSKAKQVTREKRQGERRERPASFWTT